MKLKQQKQPMSSEAQLAAISTMFWYVIRVHRAYGITGLYTFSGYNLCHPG